MSLYLRRPTEDDFAQILSYRAAFPARGDSMAKKIVLGLSGGVDSAVAARLLMEQGYEVYPLWLNVGTGAGRESAIAVAEQLGLPFAERDISGSLDHHVCRPFTADYLAGRTPLPCAVCNPTVKFPSLFAYAEQMGAEQVATGHYARCENGVLKKGRPANDQSYLLSRLSREQLARAVFPLGGYEKNEVRALAGLAALPVADKPDSMEICFIPDGDYAAWLDARGETPPPGDFVSPDGTVLGRHKGIHHYTLGQRRGLGVSGPHRYFVSAIDVENNRVVLSDGADLHVQTATCRDLNWIAVDGLTGPRACTVRLRHSKTETAATISPDGGRVIIATEQTFRAPTPGQLAVFYDGDSVLGSGWIE